MRIAAVNEDERPLNTMHAVILGPSSYRRLVTSFIKGDKVEVVFTNK